MRIGQACDTVSFHLQQRPLQECQLPLDRFSVPAINERQKENVGYNVVVVVVVVFLQLFLPWLVAVVVSE